MDVCKGSGPQLTKKRKLPLKEIISVLLCMEGGSLTSELLRYFGCSRHTASGSAFIQQRQKINEAAFPSLLDLFVKEQINIGCIVFSWYKNLISNTKDGLGINTIKRFRLYNKRSPQVA